MDKLTYLLHKLSEESVEISKEVHKAILFGLNDCNPEEAIPETNHSKIQKEINDFMGVLHKLEEIGFDIGINESQIRAKGYKLDKYYKYHLRRVQK